MLALDAGMLTVREALGLPVRPPYRYASSGERGPRVGQGLVLAHVDGATTTATVVGNTAMAAALLATVAVFLRGGASLPRLAAFAAGATVLAVALAPSVDARAEGSFSAHMAQHLALTVVAAPLLVLARPVPPLARGLPVVAPLLVGAERLLTRSSRRAEVLWAVGWCAAFVVGFWAWHVPVAYEAALRYDAVHVAQHVTYVVTALGFWWSVLGPLRRRHPVGGRADEPQRRGLHGGGGHRLGVVGRPLRPPHAGRRPARVTSSAAMRRERSANTTSAHAIPTTVTATPAPSTTRLTDSRTWSKRHPLNERPPRCGLGRRRPAPRRARRRTPWRRRQARFPGSPPRHRRRRSAGR